MHSFRSRLKSLTWLALLALCGVTFGPSISRALLPVSAEPAMHMHHMSMDMSKPMDMATHARMMAQAKAGAVAGTAAGSQAPADSTCPLDCCALCAVAALPFTCIALFVLLLMPAERAPLPRAVRSRAAPDQRPWWSSAAPRGPPAFS